MRRFLFAVPLFCVLFLLFSCEDRQPRIHAINPRIGLMGEILTISGEHFGNTREESYVTIADVTPITSSYLEWTDTRIQVRIPEFGDSGLVAVHRDNKKSNAALFSNRETMPQAIEGEYTGIGPRILSVAPGAGHIGSVVTITGSGFGASREGSGVFFAWDASPAAAGINGSGEVEVSETEFGYELWSEREIRVRVPDGAIGGNLTVRTNRGSARPVFFDVTGRPGTKTYKDKRSYAISYSADIRVAEAESPNRLYLWMPRPVNSASQRNVQTLSRTLEPFIENYRGTTLFLFQDLQSGANTDITLSYLVEVYAVETDMSANPAGGTGTSPITAAYTAPSSQIPSDDPRIKERSAAIVGREQNPFTKARRIYNYLLTEGGIQEAALPGGSQADPYTAALLFCALARAADIPAIPVSGVLMNRNTLLSRHYWAEFWVDGFGWTPVDPALGAGAAPTSFILPEDRANYYFGSLDNQRITFSRGFTTLSQMDPRGRVVIRERNYALQNLWEEAVGGLTSYSSLWSDVTLNGAY